MFKTVGILIFISINLYLFIRGWQALPINSITRFLYTSVFLFIVISVVLSFFQIVIYNSAFGPLFALIRGYWLFFVLPFLLIAISADLLRILNYLFDIFPEIVINNYAQLKNISFITVSVVLILISIKGSMQAFNTQVVELNLSVEKIDNRLGDLNIVAASDLHIGTLILRKRLAKWIALINSQNPDVILLVGDIFDRSFNPHDSKDIIGELRKLRSKYGVYAVLGNHEYHFNIKESMGYLGQAGITLLRDESINVSNKLVIIGRDDALSHKRKTIDSLIYGIDFSLPVIMMDHQPYDLLAAERNKIDLYLSGHNHNGQIFPGNILYGSFWELPYGYLKKGNTHFYVSSGLGLIYIPLRLGTQSEIVSISLKGVN